MTAGKPREEGSLPETYCEEELNLVLCPLCNTELPDGARECTRCDWVRSQTTPRFAKGTGPDWAALYLSSVPGLGHLYKGHLLTGALIFFVIAPLVLTLGIFMMPATFGVSLVLPLIFMCLVMLHAYRAKNQRAHIIAKIREREGEAVRAH